MYTWDKKKKKLQAIILWSFNDPRIPKGTVTGLFLYFQYLSMKTWSYTLRKIFTAKPAIQKQHTAATRGAQSPESTRCSCSRQQPRSTRPRDRKCDRLQHRDPEDNGQWRMGGGRGGGGRGLSPPPCADNKTTTTAALGTEWQDQHDVKTRSLWEMNTNSSCQALQKRKKLNVNLWWAHILKRILSCGQRKFFFFFQTGLRIISKIWISYSLTSKNINVSIFPG